MIDCYLIEAKQKSCPGKDCGGQLKEVTLRLRSKKNNDERKIIIAKCTVCGKYAVAKGQYYTTKNIFSPYPDEMYGMNNKTDNSNKTTNANSPNKIQHDGEIFNIILLEKSKPLSVCPKCKCNTTVFGVFSQSEPDKKVFFQKCQNCKAAYIRKPNYDRNLEIIQRIMTEKTSDRKFDTKANYEKESKPDSFKSRINVSKDDFEKGGYSIRIIPKGKTLPLKCFECSADTLLVTYLISKNGRQKKLNGRACQKCLICYFGESMCNSHREAVDPFVDSEQLETKDEKMKVSLSKEDAAIQGNSVENINVENLVGLDDTSADDDSKENLPVEPEENMDIIPRLGSENTATVENIEEVIWARKKQNYENMYDGKEAFWEAFQITKCPVCSAELNGDPTLAWVRCERCKSIFCEEDYKQIFCEPVIIVGRKR